MNDSDYAEGQSEWNEQQLFAQLFFSITKDCRYFQSCSDLLNWKTCLESKISLVMGILTIQEQKRLVDILKKINAAATTNMKMAPEKRSALFFSLFYGEAEIDTLTHSKMPFLRLNKKVDIGGM